MSVLWNDIDEGSPTSWPSWLWDIAGALRGMYPKEVGKFRDQRSSDFAQYRDKPQAYFAEVLKSLITNKQNEICEKLLLPPYKVIAVSANNVGKSYLAGGLVNWFYDSFDPGVCISTAPRKQDVEDVLWKEVRTQRKTRWDFPGDKAPELFDRPDHYAKGYTGSNAEAFHGRHDERLLFIIDEATAVKPFVWQGIKSMFKGNGKHFLFAALNPTRTDTTAYAEAESGRYHVIHLSALDHPNIEAELKGLAPPIPGAVDCYQLTEWLHDPEKFEVVSPEDFQIGDVIWPPPWADKFGALERFGLDGQRLCFRPTPEGQARVLGVWPSSTPGAVWSDLAWKAAMRAMPGQERLKVSWRMWPHIGCDVAVGTADRSDKTEIVVQIEGVAIEHRIGAGWDPDKTARVLIERAEHWARVYNANRPFDVPFLRPKHLPIKIDDNGVGAGVTAIVRRAGYRAIPINASTIAKNPEKYPLMRDQLWFAVPLAARRGEIDLSRLSKKSQQQLREQAMGVRWALDLHGRRKVERKEETKRRIGRSPDGMDGLNLAYCAVPAQMDSPPQILDGYSGPWQNQQQTPKGPIG